MTALFGVTGWKNSGKTTLVARLVTEFRNRGLKVATIKHASDGFEIDHEGTDSYRHRDAGANETMIGSGKRWALMHEVQPDESAPTLPELIGKLSPCDIVLIEGYKNEPHSKIECIRAASAKDTPVYQSNSTVVAIAHDGVAIENGLPAFNLDDISSIADFIAEHI